MNLNEKKLNVMTKEISQKFATDPITIRPNNITKGKLSNIDSLLIHPKHSIEKFIEIEGKDIKYVKSESNDEKIIGGSLNPFVQAVYLAFSNHLPLIISPDMIWYLISNGIAVHINKNSESLRKKFVNHDGKKKITVVRNDFLLNSSTNPWNEVIDEFSMKIKQNTNNNVTDLFMANFTTTTKDSKVVSQIVLMDSMKTYFDYNLNSFCGIPEFKIFGIKKDWEDIKTKANAFLKLIPELRPWFDSLNEILDNFIGVFDKSIDNNFWNSIFKLNNGCGDPGIGGWIIALFPYLNNDFQNYYVLKTSWKHSSDIFVSSFDYQMNQVPFIWKYYNEEIKMLFVGGFIGVSYQSDDSLMPVFGYAITLDKIIPRKYVGISKKIYEHMNNIRRNSSKINE